MVNDVSPSGERDCYDKEEQNEQRLPDASSTMPFVINESALLKMARKEGVSGIHLGPRNHSGSHSVKPELMRGREEEEWYL